MSLVLATTATAAAATTHNRAAIVLVHLVHPVLVLASGLARGTAATTTILQVLASHGGHLILNPQIFYTRTGRF